MWLTPIIGGIRRRIYGKSALSIPYSPLMDCHFYTSANGERAVNRICLVSFLRCLHWRIVTSTLLQMENRRWAVYALCSSFVVSIDGLLLLTSANEERAVSRIDLVFFPHCLHWWIVTSTFLQMESLPTFPFYTSHDKNWLSMTISDRRFRPVLFFLYFVFRNNTGCVI